MQEYAQTDLALKLRALWERRGLSIEQAAKKAKVSASTLRRWERGEYKPQMGALTLALQALQVSEAEKKEILLLLDAPRGQAARRDMAASQNALADWMPGAGDLWRAMRMRRGLTGAALAKQMRVHPSVVTRWEKSEAAPPQDRLDELFHALCALPDERAALCERRLLLAPPLPPCIRSLEECAERLNAYHTWTREGRRYAGELCYLTVEAQLWPLAARSARARRLLAEAYVRHAEFAVWQGRLPLVSRYAHRALDLLDDSRDTASLRLSAGVCCAHHLSQTGGENSGLRAMRYLQQWQDVPFCPRERVEVLRTLAEYAGRAGRFGQAFAWMRQARAGAESFEDKGIQRMGNIIEARLLWGAGRSGEALPLLAPDDDFAPPQRLFELLLWTQTLLALNDRAGASDWLRKFFAHVETHQLEYQRWQGDQLARQL